MTIATGMAGGTLRLGSTVRVGSNGLPAAPVEIVDEVELYARRHGRTGTLHFIPVGGWMARFSLRSNDRRMIMYQEGRAAAPPTEDIWFHQNNPLDGKPTGEIVNGRPVRHGRYVPLDICQMGASGVREFLEKGDTFSGRGEFQSVEESVKKALAADDEAAVKLRAGKREDAKATARDRRRSLLKIPVVPVAVDLKREEK
jgi:hypothetical protein